MPVASPTRFSTSSSITGSYRSTLSSSTSLDKPYYRSSSGSYVSSTLRSSYGDRTTEYRSRYSDIDGKKERKTSLVEYGRNSRAPSVTDSDSGLRYRSDRSESRSRDISTTRSESGKTTSEPLSRNKRSFVTSAALAMSTAELYDKYSPNNYIPLTQRLQQASSNYGEISRSKSISNDIGRPPSDPKSFRKARNSAATITERPESRRYKELSPSTYTKRSNGAKETNGKDSNGAKDSNGNEVPSVSEIRKRFDPHMTVTKLPANETRYHKHVETYLSQLKDSDNGIGYTKVRDDKIVPVHLPYVDKKYDVPNQNGKSDLYSKYDLHNGRSHSNTELSQITDKNHVEKMSTSLNSKIPSDRLASIKSQLDPNNPIGKILEKSTVIQVKNDDFKKYNSDSKFDYDKSDSKYPDSNFKYPDSKLDADKKARHTSNFASYIQMSQPIASGASPKKTDTNDEKTDKTRKSLKYIDSENEKSSENEIESPSGTGFENKTFEHQNFLKMRVEKEKNGDVKEAVSMETSTESTLSEATEELSPDTPTGRRRISDSSEERTELAGGKSGPSGLRRSSERSDSLTEGRTERSSQTSGLNGLRNIGNTCFMNSVVQCLSNTRPLLEYLSGDKYVSEINTTLSCMRGALIGAFAHVIKELWRSGERECVVNTSTFKSQVQRFAPRFMGYNQQDAQEFLRYLLEGLHEDVNRITVKPKPILTEIDDNLTDSAKAAEAWSRYLRMEESRVGDIFVGQLKSTLRCTHCRHDSVTFDPFWDLSLPIPSRTGNLKLQQCLQHFTKEEELDGDEKPTCSKCGVRRKCLKWFTVQKFPQVLVLHLKRFSPTERFRGKLNVLVEFPLNNLEMGPYAASKGTQAIYNLYAVSNHSGTTYSGHYTAYCKHPYTGEWHEYNDSRVTPIKARDVVSSEAYVLFYELAKST